MATPTRMSRNASEAAARVRSLYRNALRAAPGIVKAYELEVMNQSIRPRVVGEASLSFFFLFFAPFCVGDNDPMSRHRWAK